MKKIYFLFLLFLIGTTLSAQSNAIYGLEFRTGQLRLTSLDDSTGQVNVISNSVLSPDMFQQGVADFDPINKRYFYVRQPNGNTQFYTVDALTGNTINAPVISNTASNVVSAITNIGYNWLNDTIYGLEHAYNGQTLLRLVSIDPVSGNRHIISPYPISRTPYLSGNSDIDPIHRHYYYATTDSVYTVSLDDGVAINRAKIITTASNVVGIVNLAYNWKNGKLYGLQFQSQPGRLKLCELNPVTGVVTVLSNSVLSPDGFSMGNSDIDPSNDRYFYTRGGNLYNVDLNTGNLNSITPIQNPNNAISPITSISYDDLATPPPPLPMRMGDSTSIQANGYVTLDAYVGMDANYLWNTGDTTSSIQVSQPNTYSVTITKDNVTISGSIKVLETSTNTNSIDLNANIKVFPNPTNNVLQYDIQVKTTSLYKISIINNIGQVIRTYEQQQSKGELSLDDLSNGTYYISFQNNESRYVQVFIKQ